MKSAFFVTHFITIFLLFGLTLQDDSWVKDPSLCEVCKFLATELKQRLTETGKSKEVLETGHGLDTKKKRIKYHVSELRLTEALQDPHVCEKILEYNVHAEREGSNRYAKGRSETMNTLHGLKDKGVKVELGIPESMWDSPSAEVTRMQRKCFYMVEQYEDDIEEWYFHEQSTDLLDYLCKDKALKPEDQECLSEVFVPKKEEEGNKKGDTGNEAPKKEKKNNKSKESSKSKKKSKTKDKDEL